MPRAAPFVTGQVIACYAVVACLSQGRRAREDKYRVRTTCCGLEMIRDGRALVAAQYDERTQCPPCEAARRKQERAAADVVVPVVPFPRGTLVGPARVLGLGTGPEWRRVRWACCGREEAVKVARLLVLRHWARLGSVTLCPHCLEQSQRARPKRWLPASAVLPAGVIPAGLAWPRPASLR